MVRQSNGSLLTHFNLVRAALEPYFSNGIDVLIVMDDVPWAFINAAERKQQMAAGCKYGCVYLPPDDPQEFCAWIGTLAAFISKEFGAKWAVSHTYKKTK